MEIVLLLFAVIGYMVGFGIGAEVWGYEPYYAELGGMIGAITAPSLILIGMWLIDRWDERSNRYW